MTNREIALIWMADILGRLYEAWPRRTTFKMQDTCLATGVEPGTLRQREELWRDLWLWMAEEGIVRVKMSQSGPVLANRIELAVLTSRGFEALSSTEA